MNDVTRHYLISGLVQGVGYRAFACRAAEVVGATGWVRNLTDGRVELVAKAKSAAALDDLATALRQGPAHGRVDDVVTVEWPGESGPFSKFEQRKDSAKICVAP